MQRHDDLTMPGGGRGNTFPPHPHCPEFNLCQRTGPKVNTYTQLVNYLILIKKLSNGWGPLNNARLPALLHLPGIGLKSIKKHLEDEGNTIHDSFCKAFCITMFKFIHIHPTVSISQKSKLKSL